MGAGMVRQLAPIGVAAVAVFLAGTAPAQDNADQRFAALAADHWEWYERDSPVSAAFFGDNRYNDRLTDESPEAVRARKAHWRDLLTQLRSFDPAQLSTQNRVSLQVLTTIATDRTRIDGFFGDLPFGAANFSLFMGWSPVTQMYGPQFFLPQLAKSAPSRTVADFDAYLKRLGAIPRLLAQYQVQMRAAIDAGWVPAAVAIQRVPGQLDSQIVADATQSALYLPFSKFPTDFAEADQRRLTESAR